METFSAGDISLLMALPATTEAPPADTGAKAAAFQNALAECRPPAPEPKEEQQPEDRPRELNRDDTPDTALQLRVYLERNYLQEEGLWRLLEDLDLRSLAQRLPQLELLPPLEPEAAEVPTTEPPSVEE